MPIKSIFGNTFDTIERSLDISGERHGIITNNIDKLDTPDCRPKEIDFKSVFKEAMEGTSVSLFRTNPRHFGSEISYAEQPLDGTDSVNIDRAMSKLAENNVRYRASVEVLLRKLSRLRYAIAEGGR